MGSELLSILSPPIQMNPMLNEVIIQVIFSHLDVTTLKSVRFVHTSWARKAFLQLRKLVKVKLDSTAKLKKFLHSEVNYSFFGFGFALRSIEWTQDLFDYLKSIELWLDINFLLDLEETNCYKSFSDIISQLSNKIQFLSLTVNWNGSSNLPSLEDSLLKIQYPILETLAIRNKKVEPQFLTPLFTEMIKSSPNLKEIEVDIQDCEFWKKLKIIKNLKNITSLIIPKVNYEIVRTCVAIPYLKLKKLHIQFEPSEIPEILYRFASSLKSLRFFTPDESALSPINFPLMPNLKFLDAGQSQLSFPSILSDKLPALKTLRATFWDWVYTFEDLPPDIHYYWQTYQPHQNVTTFVIHFPDRDDITGNYVAMENFSDFAERIKVKFSNLTNIRIENAVIMREDFHHCFEDITLAFGPQLKELIITSFEKHCDWDSNQLFPASLSSCTNLEVLDFNPHFWSSNWEQLHFSRNISVDKFNEILTPLTKLRVLKIPHIQDFSFQKLLGDEFSKFPSLITLDLIGNHCLKTLKSDKIQMKTIRPDIRIRLYDCYCSDEDNWYMHDEKSNAIFQNLFEI